MAKTLIVLKGRGNIGKSTTIRLAFDNFIRAQDVTLIEHNKTRARDFRSIVEIAVPNIKVGFTSAGDNEDEIKENIQNLAAAGCEIIVCSSRMKGKPYNAISAFSKRWKLDFHPQIQCANHADRIKSNNATAAKLIWRIREHA